MHGLVRALWLLAAGLMTLTAGRVAAEPDEAAATWQRAHVAIPAPLGGDRPVIGLWHDREVQQALPRVAPGGRVPAVLFMHGCADIGHEEESWKLLLIDLGYAALFPDSFARTGRQANCDPASYGTAPFPAAHEQRQEEIAHALSQLRRIPWVDPARIFLFGYSEGGMAAARYAGGGLADVVILGWHCQGVRPYQRIHAAPDIPVLAIMGESDPWYEARSGLHCGLLFGGRGGATSLVLPGNGHDILTAPNVANAERAKDAVRAFLGGAAVER